MCANFSYTLITYFYKVHASVSILLRKRIRSILIAFEQFFHRLSLVKTSILTRNSCNIIKLLRIFKEMILA